MRARSLDQEDPLEEETAIHSSIPACEMPWTEKPSRPQSMGSQRVGHDWACTTHPTFAFSKKLWMSNTASGKSHIHLISEASGNSQGGKENSLPSYLPSSFFFPTILQFCRYFQLMSRAWLQRTLGSVVFYSSQAEGGWNGNWKGHSTVSTNGGWMFGLIWSEAWGQSYGRTWQAMAGQNLYKPEL